MNLRTVKKFSNILIKRPENCSRTLQSVAYSASGVGVCSCERCFLEIGATVAFGVVVCSEAESACDGSTELAEV